MKICIDCKEEKEIDDFYKHPTYTGGHYHRCKPCHAKISMQWAKDNPEKRKKAERRATLKYYHNLSLEDYDTMLENQNGGCAICGKTQEKNTDRRSLAVDHCHRINKIRGILCDKCNRGIGYLDDNPTIARKAAEYLERFIVNDNKT